MKIPFDIKYRPQIESGEYRVETRDGKKVRVLCYDANNIVPIVALVTFNDGSEGSRDYYFNGTMNFDRENPLDLFIVTPEPTDMSEFGMKVSEFAEAYELAATDCESEEYKTCNGNLQLIIDKYAAEILALARKELENEAPSIIHAQSFNAGLKHGKAEALKDVPRWEDIRNFAYSWTSESKTFYSETLGQLFHKGKRLFIGDLEKLPGFKEDEK